MALSATMSAVVRANVRGNGCDNARGDFRGNFGGNACVYVRGNARVVRGDLRDNPNPTLNPNPNPTGLKPFSWIHGNINK